MQYASKINEFFEGSKTLFLIPLYQRTYAWEEDNCKRLFDDLIKVHRKNLASHFFGTIVSVKDNEIDDDLLIIDGQQRITTISLIILALLNAVKNGDIAYSCDVSELEEYSKIYLYAVLRKNVTRKIKLRPIERDLKAYDALFTNDRSKFVKGCGITDNYDFFYEQITSCGLTFEQLLAAVERLIIIDLRLDNNDEPQLIFESLNSTGKDLTEADKVRNYLLMSLTKQQQDDYYHKYWVEIENCTDDKPTMFIRDFLTIKKLRICNIQDLYFEFKEYDEEQAKDRESFLQELLRFAQYYKMIVQGEYGDADIDKKFKQLASIGSAVGNPFYLSFLDYAKQNGLDNELVYEVLDVTENYWARRIICGYPANTLAKLFASLHNDVMRVYATHERRSMPLDAKDYAEVMKYILLKKQGNATFPADAKVRLEFPTRQIYKLPISYRYFLFERFENGNSKEGIKPVVEAMRENKITIEHIMPQTLTPDWRRDLGDDFEDIYNRYLNTFANLTITGYNSSLGNHSFYDKKYGYTDKKGDHVPGYKDSHYHLTDYLKTVDQWTKTEITEREGKLLEQFFELWPMITTSYTPLEKDVESVSFDDSEYDFTGRRIASFTYRGTKYEVSTWKDTQVAVCKLIYAEEPSTIVYLSKKDNWLHSNDAKEYTKVGDDVYVFTSCSTRTKIACLRFVFEKCNISESELIFQLAPLTDKVNELDDDV